MRYYIKFVKGYGTIAAPLTDLLKKCAFHWTPAAIEAFNQLKQALLTHPVLSMPNFEEDFVVETDASGTGLGDVLMQKGHPIAYISQKFKGNALNLSAYEKDHSSSSKKWRQYLLERKFIIKNNYT